MMTYSIKPQRWREDLYDQRPCAHDGRFAHPTALRKTGRPSELVGTFVDLGILHQLDNKNSQIFYGRRGTGKTHVLRVLGSRLREEDQRNTVFYIDARTLGSTEQFTDQDQPIGQRCLALFQDILVEIYNALLEHIVNCPSASAERALEAADELISVSSSNERGIRNLTPDPFPRGKGN
jgi:Cdc6-like AAA superfamily ATPase